MNILNAETIICIVLIIPGVCGLLWACLNRQIKSSESVKYRIFDDEENYSVAGQSPIGQRQRRWIIGLLFAVFAAILMSPIITVVMAQQGGNGAATAPAPAKCPFQ